MAVYPYGRDKVPFPGADLAAVATYVTAGKLVGWEQYRILLEVICYLSSQFDPANSAKIPTGPKRCAAILRKMGSGGRVHVAALQGANAVNIVQILSILNALIQAFLAAQGGK